MPIPKEFAKKYGVIVATLQKQGFSLGEAKRKADKAIADLKKKRG